jgi:LPS-assembly protein
MVSKSKASSRSGLAFLGAAAITAALGSAWPSQAQTPLEMLGVTQEQGPAALVADSVSYDETAGTLTARGNVEIYYGSRTLTAQEIVYESRTERIRATGPLALRDATGTTVLADFADIDSNLRDGVIRGARAFIADGAGALSAVEARRTEGRYTTLSKAVYSSCQVCPTSPTPLWSIRARRIVHDEVERMVHYEDPVFEIMGVPVGWLPYFSHPDPSVKRKSGFLAPTFSQSTNYGFGAKLPYFWAIDPSSDLTVTPFVTTRDGFIGEADYRRRFDFGRLDVAGSMGFVDQDDGEGRQLQGHVFGDGRFRLSRFGFAPGTETGFDVNLSSDEGYLRRYGFSSQDRLTSRAYVENWRGNEFFQIAGLYFQSLRDEEPTDEIPIALPEFSMRRSFSEDLTGGELGLEGGGVVLTRSNGRDVARLTAQLDWSREVIVPFGVALRGFGALRGDVYRVDDDPAYPDQFTTRFAPRAGIEARLPLIAYEASAAHLVEPIMQFVAAPTGLNDDDIPNEDSLLVEFDETNLFDLNRFPGYDRVEEGSRINVGLRYGRISDDPWRLDAAVGQVFRLTEETSFSPGSGLGDQTSDYVAAWTAGYEPYFLFTNRLRVSTGGELARNEIAARASYGPGSITTQYLFLESDADAGAFEDREEVALGAAFDVTNQWRVEGFVRRDLQNERYVEASAGLTFRNECAQLELYVDRDFTDSQNVEEGTSVGLRVRVFGAADGGGARSAVCAQYQ